MTERHTSGSDDGPGGHRKGRKVERVADRYGLEQLPAELAERWSADVAARNSLRDLAALFNRRVLAAAIARAGENLVDGEAANYYRLLTDEDVSSGRRLEVRRRLEGLGVDVSAVEGDFVSHQTVHNYLLRADSTGATSDDGGDRAGTTGPDDHGDAAANVLATIERLQGRLDAVVQDNLSRLRSSGRLALGRFEVIVQVSVICQDCGASKRMSELVRDGGCECDQR